MEGIDTYVMVPADEYKRISKQSAAQSSIPTRDASVMTDDIIYDPGDGIVGDQSDVAKESKTAPPPTLLSKDSVIAAIPHKFRSKASRLLDVIGDRILWNEKGELLKQNGDSIPDSHISDLIKDLYYTYKKVNLPGRDHFAKNIEEMHLPQTLTGCMGKKCDLTKKGSKKLVKHEKTRLTKWITL